MTLCLKKFRLLFYQIIWKISYPFIYLYYSIKGYYRVNNVLDVESVYYVSNTNRYYKYLGKKYFKEGNKIVDVGFLCIEMPGDYKVMSYMKIGMFNFMFIKKDFNIFDKNKIICLQRK